MLPPAIRLIVRLIAAAIAALSIALAILAWRLSSGPISLTLLTPYLQDALNRGGMTLRVEVLDTALAWAGRDRTLELQAKEVRLINAEGRPVAVLPQLSLALSGAALLRGLVAPETLDLLASRLRVIRTAAGHFRVDTTQEGSVIDLTAMKEILSPPDPERASGYLRRISALDADITFRDEATGTQWRLRQADLVLLRDHSGVHGDLSGQLEQGAGPPAEIGARGSLDEPGARIEIDMRFAGVRPPHLASANAPLAPLAAAAMVFSGTAQLVVGLDGTLSEVTLVVASEQPGTFTLAKEFAEPIPLASAAARVRIAPGFDRITIDEVRLEADDTEATFVGELRRTADGPDVVLHAAIARLRVDDLPRYWPLAVGPLAREWFATNIAGGLITTATMDLALPPSVFAHAPIPAGGVAIAFAFEGASGRYFMGFPPITNAAGSGTLTEAELRTEIHSGRIGAIALSEGVAVITGVNQPQARASFDLVGRGGLGDFVALLDRPPLDLAAKLDLDRDALAGKVAARARFVMPVKRGLTPGEVNYAAAANTQGVALGEVFAGYALTDGDLEVRIGRDGIAASGEAALNGVPLTVRWRRDLAASGAPDTYELSGRLDDQGRAALNLATGAYLTGPILAAATARAQAGALIEASAQLDLAAAVVTVPELRWAKPAGTPGTVAFSVSGGAEGGFLVRDIAASLGDLTAAGEVAIASGPRFERATLKSVRFGSNDFAASLRPIPGGGLVIGASGARFDLRPFSDDLFDFEERGDLPPLRLNAQFDRLIVREGLELAEVAIGAAYDERWEALKVEGRFTTGDPLAVTLGGRGGGDGEGRRLAVRTDNAGAFLRALDLFDTVEGGTLNLSADVVDAAGHPVRGLLQIDDFRVVRAPVLTRLLTLASLTGIAEVLRGQGISFTRFRAPFELAGDRITTTHARAVGPAIGVTVAGTIDRATDVADLAGTMVPAYTINSILGSIPILGSILGGKEGEGVIGLTYRIAGPRSDPEITVNPLSALAPGVLRDLVTSLERGAGQASEPRPDGGFEPPGRQ